MNVKVLSMVLVASAALCVNTVRAGTPEEAGAAAFTSLGCVACHNAPAPGVASLGPELAGIYGTDVKLADGSTVKVDDAYIKESILAPAAKIVDGFQTAAPMTPFEGIATEEQITQLIAYIKSLKK